MADKPRKSATKASISAKPAAKPAAKASAPVAKVAPVKAPAPVKAAAPVKAPVPAPEPVNAVPLAPAPVEAAPVMPVPVTIAEPVAEKAPAPETVSPEPVLAVSAITPPVVDVMPAEVPAETTPVETTPAEIKTAEPEIAAKPVIAPTVKKEITIMETTFKNAAEKTQALFADMSEFNKGNVEALVESSKIAAKAFETIGQEAAEYSRKSFESATAALKSLSSVKSPTEFMKLHSDYVRQSFDALVTESSKATETMLKVAGEISQPISNRIAVAAEKIKIAA
jgi:phasin family protein